MELIKRAITSGDPPYWIRVRRRRFKLFASLLEEIPKPFTILDVGGTQVFWEWMDFTEIDGVDVVLFNTLHQETRYENFNFILGDAVDLSMFGDNHFDVIFSSSVIEHLSTMDRQQLMAGEIRRVGKRYFLQTPNYWSPIEPHFFFPGFQWFPMWLKVYLVRTIALGWSKRISDPIEAEELINGVRLLRKKEIRALFPEAVIDEERLFGISYSLILYGGW